jgi:hypothetical protein
MVTYHLPPDLIHAPGPLVISGWSKAVGVTGPCDGDYALYIDVAYRDGSYLYGKMASFRPGTHDWQYAAVVIDLERPVKSLALHLLFRGNHAGTVWMDDVYAAAYRPGTKPYDGNPLAYVTSPRTIRAARQVVEIEQKIAVLQEALAAIQARGADAADLRVTLAVARLFAKFIPVDAGLDVEDYPRDMSDFSILGRTETLQRIADLPGFEAAETERLLDAATGAARQTTTAPARTPIAPGRAGKIAIRNGTFYDADRPVFLSGINDNSNLLLKTPQNIELLKMLGANLVGPVDPSSLDGTRGWDAFDDAYFQKHVLPLYDTARASGLFAVAGLWSYPAPPWLAQLAPDIVLQDDHGWFRDYLDLDHPLAERHQRLLFGHLASQWTRLPNNFTQSLMGEEWCDPHYRGPHTPGRYQAWLRAKHGDIRGLNRAWGTAYRNFAEAAAKESLQTKGGYYDWYTFNEFRLTTLNQWQIDAIRAADPGAMPSCWPAAGCLVSVPLGGFDPRWGRNREEIIRQSAVTGWDGGILSYEAGPTRFRLPKAHWAKYNMGWRDELIYYDFAKSICPEKPIFDPELHSLTSVAHISPLGVPADYFRTSLWLEHLHGMSAHLLWWWGRREDGSPTFLEFLGGLLTQPQLLDCWGKTVLELRRLTDYIVLFPQLERRVRILYSEASAIQDGKAYPEEIGKVYEALYFLDYPVGFITEKMIQEGRLDECSLLVIPAAKYVGNATAAAIAQFQRRGGRVVATGEGSLAYDEYGKPRSARPALARLSGATAEEYRGALDPLLDQLAIQRPVRAETKEGQKAWGVELRAACRDSGQVVYLVNLNHETLDVRLATKRPVKRATDLIQRKGVKPDAPLALPPRKPMLLELSY